jgi:hypothetical protein
MDREVEFVEENESQREAGRRHLLAAGALAGTAACM